MSPSQNNFVSIIDEDTQVLISPTRYEDLPDLAEGELLAFSNTAMSSVVASHRAQMRAAGISPRAWPDFHATVRRRARAVASHGPVFTARVRLKDADSSLKKDLALSSDNLSKPISIMKVSFSPIRKRPSRTWTDFVWGDVLYPIMDGLGIGGTLVGMNKAVFGVIHTQMKEARDEFMKDRPYAAIDMFFVNPAYQGHGVGSALLKNIIKISNEAGLPIILEATPEAVPLYERHGFVKLKDINMEYDGTKFSLHFMLREMDAK